MGWLPGQEYYNFNIWLNLVLAFLIIIIILLVAILLKLHLNHVELMGFLKGSEKRKMKAES
ncbi:MAG: hypothetical protein QXN95_04035 [Candidatus Bathyarchaeia archaeon]